MVGKVDVLYTTGFIFVPLLLTISKGASKPLRTSTLPTNSGGHALDDRKVMVFYMKKKQLSEHD